MPGLAVCQSQFGVTTQHWVAGRHVQRTCFVGPTLPYDTERRSYVLHVPPHVRSRGRQTGSGGLEEDTTCGDEEEEEEEDIAAVPLVVFAHGARGSAWHHALHRTRWIEKAAQGGFLVAFLQAGGPAFRTPQLSDADPSVPISSRGFGDFEVSKSVVYRCQAAPVWLSGFATTTVRSLCLSPFARQVREFEPQFEHDMAYVEAVVEHVKLAMSPQHRIHPRRTYYVGHSNGGVFSCHVALRLAPRVFARVVNCMGGIGWDSLNSIDFSATGSSGDEDGIATEADAVTNWSSVCLLYTSDAAAIYSV